MKKKYRREFCGKIVLILFALSLILMKSILTYDAIYVTNCVHIFLSSHLNENIMFIQHSFPIFLFIWRNYLRVQKKHVWKCLTKHFCCLLIIVFYKVQPWNPLWRIIEQQSCQALPSNEERMEIFSKVFVKTLNKIFLLEHQSFLSQLARTNFLYNEECLTPPTRCLLFSTTTMHRGDAQWKFSSSLI